MTRTAFVLLAGTAFAAFAALPAAAQQPSGSTGTTSGPAAGTPATMDTGNGAGMTASPHQAHVLKKKHHSTGTGDKPANDSSQDNSDPQNAPK